MIITHEKAEKLIKQNKVVNLISRDFPVVQVCGIIEVVKLDGKSDYILMKKDSYDLHLKFYEANKDILIPPTDDSVLDYSI